MKDRKWKLKKLKLNGFNEYSTIRRFFHAMSKILYEAKYLAQI